MKLFVDINVSSEKSVIYFLDNSDTILKEIALANDINGASAIKEMILDFRQSFDYEKMVMEIVFTSSYSFHSAPFLSKNLQLKSLDIVEVMVQNQKAIDRYKGLFEEDKNNRIERYNKTILKQERYVTLQCLIGSRYQMIHQLTEYKQYFLENLYSQCNKLSKEFDTSVFGAIILDILSNSLSLNEIAEMDLENLANSYEHFSNHKN